MAEVGGETLPKNNAQYLRADYWDKRFASETAYEWLCAYDDVRDLIVPKLRRGDRLLVLGCGTSALPLELHDDEYGFAVTSIDISPTVIARLAHEHATARPSMRWEVRGAYPARGHDRRFAHARRARRSPGRWLAGCGARRRARSPHACVRASVFDLL